MNQTRHPARLIAALILVTLVAAGCASGPRFDTDTYRETPNPAEAARTAGDWQGTPVLWGGVILNSVNQENRTQLEVIGYPLGSAQRPDASRSAIGRFIVHEDAYLETIDYAPGRAITVTGEFTGTQEGTVGEASYLYPVMNADSIYLWPAESAERREPRVNFGVGILFGN